MSTSGILAGLMALVVGVVPAGAAAQHPDLAGSWKLNQAQSDNPRDQMRGSDSTGGERRPRGEGGGEGGGGGGGGFGGGRGGFGGGRRGGYGGGRGMSDEQRARMRQTMDLAFHAPSAFTLQQADSAVTVTGEDGQPLLLYADGRKLVQRVDGGGDLEIKAHWQGNDFVVERRVKGGGKVTEDYLRSQDGKQLFVIVGFEGSGGRSIQFRRVYDPAS